MSAQDQQNALSYAQAQMQNPSQNWYEKCQTFVRTALGFSGGTAASAAEAWSKTPAEHRHTDGSIPPAGAPVYWTGGPHGYGHVALSDGQGGIYTTDYPNRGQIGHVSIKQLNLAWGNSLKYAGWADQEAGTGKLFANGGAADGGGMSADEIYSKLSDDQKKKYDALSPEQQQAFVAKLNKVAPGLGGFKGDGSLLSDLNPLNALSTIFSSMFDWMKTGIVRAAFFIIGVLLIGMFLYLEAKRG